MERYDDDAYERTYPDGSPIHECWNAKRAFAGKAKGCPNPSRPVPPQCRQDGTVSVSVGKLPDTPERNTPPKPKNESSSDSRP